MALLNGVSILAFLCLLVSRGAVNNHISHEPLLIFCLPVLALVVEAALWHRPNRRIPRRLRLGVSCLLFGIVTFADQWNILVQYDRWLSRGMPSAGEFRISAEMKDALHGAPTP